MQTHITAEEMMAAARQLARTEPGRRAMQRMLVLLDGDGLDLDFLDRRAFLALLGGAWSGRPEQVREAIRDAIAEGPQKTAT